MEDDGAEATKVMVDADKSTPRASRMEATTVAAERPMLCTRASHSSTGVSAAPTLVGRKNVVLISSGEKLTERGALASTAACAADSITDMDHPPCADPW